MNMQRQIRTVHVLREWKIPETAERAPDLEQELEAKARQGEGFLAAALKDGFKVLKSYDVKTTQREWEVFILYKCGEVAHE